MQLNKTFIFVTPIIFILLLFNCASTVVIEKNDYSAPEKTGLYVSASHSPMQWLLYFTDGIGVQIDKGNTDTIQWKTPKFFSLAPGKHNFYIFMHYLGESGKRNGCIDVKKGQVIQFHYTPPAIVTNEGNIDITDLRTQQSLTLANECK